MEDPIRTAEIHRRRCLNLSIVNFEALFCNLSCAWDENVE